jgi:V8-like Glu-specific endopeptidase
MKRRGRDSNPRYPEKGTTVFETAPFNHSGTPPSNWALVLRGRISLASVNRFALAAVLTIALAFAAPAGAITFGTADGSGHPNVGGLVAEQAYSDGTWIYCSGTLISPTVFLTAAHCEEGDRVRVSFSSAYQDGDKIYTGTWHADPAYNQSQSDPHDIAVVVFDKPIKGITPAGLPTAGSLANLSGTQQFTSVGYGAYEVTKGPGGHQYLYNDVRGVATGTLNSITQAWLKISMNPSHGDGGTCYGDSGGPNFLGSSNIVAATTITGDSVCRSTNVTYRLDTPSARDFLAPYVALP